MCQQAVVDRVHSVEYYSAINRTNYTYNMEELQNNYAEWRKSENKYMLYEPIYIKF